MPDVVVDFGGQAAILTASGAYKAGDLPPRGYMDREEWFWVQRQAGLHQKECPRCSRWAFPQELAPGNAGCLACAAPSATP